MLLIRYLSPVIRYFAFRGYKYRPGKVILEQPLSTGV